MANVAGLHAGWEQPENFMIKTARGTKTAEEQSCVPLRADPSFFPPERAIFGLADCVGVARVSNRRQ
jgi:hypothetical protein